jgi:beta-lactamase class A
MKLLPPRTLAVYALLLLLGGVLGWLVPFARPFEKNQIVQNRGVVLRQSDSHYTYIEPLLACDIGTENSFPELVPTKNAIQAVINKEIANGNVDSVSIYVRSMKGARWFDINGSEEYAPASLIKVFVMMAYYKADDDRGNNSELYRKLVFRGSAGSTGDTPGEIIPHLVNGQTYTIDELIRQMIVYSDNDAFDTLIGGFDADTYKAFQTVFSDLQIPSPVTQSEDAMNFISVDDYAMVFRVLYSSTYLSRAYSEKALALLAGVHYKDALAAGVPSDVEVSHKFGVRSIPAAQNNGTVGAELHDCGIVYYPGHPYLLCVMTRGSNFGKLQNVIQNISQQAYSELDKFYKAGSASSGPSNTGGVAVPR